MKNFASLPIYAMLASFVLPIGCGSTGGNRLLVEEQQVQCSSQAQAVFFQRLFGELPRYVLSGSSGVLPPDQLTESNVLQRVVFHSEPSVDGCQPLRTSEPYDNTAVDAFVKKNRVVATFHCLDSSKGCRKGKRSTEHRWRGGLIVQVDFIGDDQTPALGIVEVDPDSSLTRRVLYLDGRSHEFVYRRQPFSSERLASDQPASSRDL